MNSGFLADTEIVARRDAVWSEVEVISQSSTHFVAQGVRYGRRWILKGLRADAADSELLRQQLFKEFTILSALSHPGVVSFAGLEEVDGLGLCIVMERIEGLTLEDALHEGHLSRADRRRLLLEIVGAVAYLHSQGIVHRDLKPSNIMVRRNGGSAVIIDFGLADTDAFTIVKYPAGTLGYASERQQQAATPDTSDDIYSLGVVMRQLYPEYGRIAARCQARAGRRYRDASSLLRALRRRGRLGRRIALSAASVAAAVAIAAIALLGYNNRSLRSSVENLDGQISGLREENSRQRERLADSVTTLKKRLAEESAFREGVQRHDAYIAGLKQQLRQQCYAAYSKYQRDMRSGKLNEEYKGQILCESLMALKDKFINAHGDLPEKDRVDLESAFGIYYGDIINDFYNKK